MAISSAGIGSGLDVNSLVSQLVSAERAPQAQRISTAQSRINVSLSALGSFKGALSQLQAAVKAMGSSSSIGAMTTSVSTEGLLGATAGSSAVAGSYDVEVISIAKAHKVASNAFVGGSSSVVGNGTVTIGVGGDSFDVTLIDGANTLADLRDRINAATDNTGVTATIVTEDAGARLVLSAKETGTAGAMTISSLASGGGSMFTTSDVQLGTDAQIKVDGFTRTSSSNTLTTAIDGVTINLLKAEPGTTFTLGVNLDPSASGTAVKNLVTAYNAALAVVKKFATFDPATKQGGPLMGDIGVRSAMQQLRSVFSGAAGEGDFTMLSQIGITTATDGTLTVDSTKLSDAMAKNMDAVNALFKGPEGIATQLTEALETYIGTDGRIGATTEQLQKRLETYTDQSAALDRRMALVEARYRKQFTALDTLLGQLQTTSNYLTQQLASLPGSGSN